MNVDKFSIKVKKGHVVMTYFFQERQVAQVNFPKQPLGFEILQSLQDAVWGTGNGHPDVEVEPENAGEADS